MVLASSAVIRAFLDGLPTRVRLSAPDTRAARWHSANGTCPRPFRLPDHSGERDGSYPIRA